MGDIEEKTAEMAGLIRGVVNQTRSSIEKLNNLKRAMDLNKWDGPFGWILGPVFTVFRTDDIRAGKLVGTDKYGNKYFEDKTFFIGRSRYVIYSEQVFMDYDSSQVPAEWHGWLHYMTDKTPIEAPPVEKKWMALHTENFTGTDKQYVPYSTTRPKIEAWKPPSSK